MMKTKAIENTASLRTSLLETIDGLRAGDIDSRTAATISGLTSRILQSLKLDLEYTKFTSKNGTNHSLIEKGTPFNTLSSPSKKETKKLS